MKLSEDVNVIRIRFDTETPLFSLTEKGNTWRRLFSKFGLLKCNINSASIKKAHIKQPCQNRLWPLMRKKGVISWEWRKTCSGGWKFFKRQMMLINQDNENYPHILHKSGTTLWSTYTVTKNWLQFNIFPPTAMAPCGLSRSRGQRSRVGVSRQFFLFKGECVWDLKKPRVVV